MAQIVCWKHSFGTFLELLHGISANALRTPTLTAFSKTCFPQFLSSFPFWSALKWLTRYTYECFGALFMSINANAAVILLPLPNFKSFSNCDFDEWSFSVSSFLLMLCGTKGGDVFETTSKNFFFDSEILPLNFLIFALLYSKYHAIRWYTASDLFGFWIVKITRI